MVGPRSPEEGYSSEVWVEVCRQGLQSLALFETKNCSFRYAVQGKRPYFMTLIRFVWRTELGNLTNHARKKVLKINWPMSP